MSGEKGYLQTISCNINLSSCRVRAESIARALNTRWWWWSRSGTVLDRPNGTYNSLLPATGSQATGCNAMTNIINKPPHAMEVFKTSEGYEISHCWVNDLPPEEDESYNTPPCSSPPSPADNEIIVNAPIALPFCAFLRESASSGDSKGKCQSAKHSSIYTEESKLREKLQKYADSLLLSEDVSETFYDATDDDKNSELLCKRDSNITNICNSDSNEFDEKETVTNENVNEPNINDEPVDKQDCIGSEISSVSIILEEGNKSDELTFAKSEIAIQVYPPSELRNQETELVLDTKCNSKNLFVDRRLRELQELEAEERPRLLRSTSLKTGKTPPGTPNRKKIVRFADVLGLDLEAVRHIVTDDLPNVPSSAFDDLNLPPEKDEPIVSCTTERTITWGTTPNVSTTALNCLYPLFEAPGSDVRFLERVKKDWVCLESITISVLSVHCTCRVLNVSYEKHVTARYTMDNWCTWEEVLASYVPFSSNGDSDKFSFNLYIKPGAREELISFAIRYVSSKAVRWDNNKGENYKLRYTGTEERRALLHPSNDLLDPWVHHFF